MQMNRFMTKTAVVDMAIAGVAVLFSFGCFAGVASANGDLPDDLVWNEPGKSSLDSMPIGNGDIGANVWVEPNGDILFYLSKSDAWSENCRLLKLGKVRVSMDPPLLTQGSDVVFSHKLNLKDGLMEISSVSSNRQTIATFWIDANNPVVHVDVESSILVTARVVFEPWRVARRQLKGQEAHSSYGLHGAGGKSVFVEPEVVLSNQKDCVVWYHRNVRSIWEDNLKLQGLGELTKTQQDPLMSRTFGAMIRGNKFVSSDEFGLRTTSARRRFSLSVHPLTAQTDSADEWLAKLEKQVKTGKKSSFVKEQKKHKAWWNSFWQRSWIRITGDKHADLVTQAYVFQRWVNACGGRGKSPIKFNGSIFTVDAVDKGRWNADYRRWGGPYWWQNTRLPYWSMLEAGDFDLMQPLFRMYREMLPLRQAATKKYYNHEGAFFPETQYFWGTYVDGNYGRNRSKLPLGMTDNRFIRYYWQSGLELSLMMLDYHAFTADVEFAKETMIPHVSNVLMFYDHHWKRDKNGKIRFDPAMALETYRVAVNPLVEIVGIRKVAEEMLLLSKSLISPGQRETWINLIDDLPPVPVKLVNGKKILLPAESYSGKQNTENPELYAVFPYRLYTTGKPGCSLAFDAYNRRAHKSSGGWQQSAIQAALLGLADDAKKFVVFNASRRAAGHRFPAMWGPNFDWIPDQDHGTVMMSALQRMLLQYDGDQIQVCPAWPKGWDVDFKLHAPQQTIVEGSVKDGKMVRLNVMPKQRRKDVVVEQ